MRNILFIFILCSNNGFGQTPANDPHWELVKNWDFKNMTIAEFDQDWNRNFYIHSSTPSNTDVDPFYFHPDNVTVNSTGLHLEVKEQTIIGKINNIPPDTQIMNDGLPNKRTFYYTSGYIETKPLWQKKYGYIEANIRVAYGYDFFPAFWTMASPSPVPTNASEIDIFEFTPSENYPDPNSKLENRTNVHLCYSDPTNPNNTCTDPDRDLTQNLANYANSHNLYAIEWDPFSIKWYVNGVLIRKMNNPGANDYCRIILNFSNHYNNVDHDNTTYPSTMDVEYVNFYNLRMDCETVINECTYYPWDYDNKIKKSISYGGNGCYSGVLSGQNVIFRAKESITIKGNFTVESGASLLLDASSNCY